MTTIMKEILENSPELERVMAQERLILDATEEIWRVLEDKGLTKAALAEKLGASKSHVTQILNGGRNMTLRTLADLCYVLDSRARISVEPIQAAPQYDWNPVAITGGLLAGTTVYQPVSANEDWVQLQPMNERIAA